MPNSIRIKHSFNAGDLIVLLPGLRHIYLTTGRKSIVYQRLNLEFSNYAGMVHPIQAANNPVCMNEEMFSRLKPLIEYQTYIEKFEIWTGQPYDWDIDDTRDSNAIPIPAGLIHTWAWGKFPEMSCDLSVPWVSVPIQSLKKDSYKGKIIINRTQRYTNPYATYFFLKHYQDRLLFAGTETEHILFCKQWGLEIERIEIDNFLQLAQIMQWSKGGIYNQSFCFHLADSMKTRRILELCTTFPNTFPTGAHGDGFYHQKSLELYFDKLINE